MLVHIVQPEFLTDIEVFDYDKYKLLAASDIKDYERFIKFIQRLKGHQIIIDDKWYTVENYAFKFPKDSSYVPCFIVYVYEYF